MDPLGPENHSSGLDPVTHTALLIEAIARIRDGRLPRAISTDLFAGPGRNCACALCDVRIPLAEVEYEVTLPGPDSTPRPHLFHIACYHAWTQAVSAVAAGLQTPAASPPDRAE
jgi:hypothetical protein